MIREDSLSRKLNNCVCWNCRHGTSWHTHPARRFWSQGKLRGAAGVVVTHCTREGCSCTGFATEPLTSEEMTEMTRRIRGGWRGRT
jgi:hypothetical protein